MNIYDFTLAALEEYLENEPHFRAKQIYSQLYKGFALQDMSNVPKSLREKLEKALDISLPSIDTRLVSRWDNTVKYLFRMQDGTGIESVVMPYRHGLTICVSSQAGCRMGCAFCASTVDGLERNLSAGEIMGQVLAAEKDLQKRISHVVMMGSGEPMDNFENVMRFVHNAIDPNGLGISARHITISTCGLPGGIPRLQKEKLPINLAVSLHAPNDEIRRALMPTAQAVTVERLIMESKAYFCATHRRVTFEYALIRGVNDAQAHAKELARRLKGNTGFHVNLIPVNSIAEREFQRSDKETAAMFLKTLTRDGVQATIRRKMGADIDAACGQLRRSKKTER